MEENIQEDIIHESETKAIDEGKLDYQNLPFHPRQEVIVDALCDRTGTDDRNFFRVMVAYKFCEIATMMRTTVNYIKTTNIPVNMYALNLAPSGYSKNASMNVLDKEVFNGFKSEFMCNIFQKKADLSLALIADEMSLVTGTDVEDCYKTIKKEYSALPKFLYSFGDSTPEGFKASRSKLSMANIGSTSNILDEIGSNLTKNKESFTVMLEAYDMGDNKQKLIKTEGGNSDLKGSVPSNLFAFGTHSKLLDGDSIEKDFFSMLEEGFGRRFVVGFVERAERKKGLTALEMYDMISNPMTSTKLATESAHMKSLADIANTHVNITMSKDVEIELIKYRLECERIADTLKEHDEILKAVIAHSYWRVLKIAGAYAFIDNKKSIDLELLKNAIALSEEGIKSFKSLLNRKKPYERLAEYIGESDKELTQVDLVEDLMFYKGSDSHKKELMSLATAYAYSNNIVIKRSFRDGIEFISGDKIYETDISKIKCSWSKDIATGYKSAESSFNKLHQLVCADGFEYCSHSFKGGNRNSESAIEGFNLLILDVDGGLNIETCKNLLKDYTYLLSTTKRHTEKHHRYRIIFPMSHELKLSPKDYSKFMENVFDWLPFESDTQTKDIARKWSSFKGTYHYNYGTLIDVLPFIPNTTKEEKRKQITSEYKDTESLQRWFLINRANSDYGRNNMLRDYALALLDSGMISDNIRHSVVDLNNKLEEKLDEREIESTIMKTVIKKEVQRELEEEK